LRAEIGERKFISGDLVVKAKFLVLSMHERRKHVMSSTTRFKTACEIDSLVTCEHTSGELAFASEAAGTTGSLFSVVGRIDAIVTTEPEKFLE
jgi:hypothetical protein